jgi:hypothetical protein
VTPAERLLLANIRRRSSNMTPEGVRRLLAAYRLVAESMSEVEIARALNRGTLDRFLDEVLAKDALDGAFADLREMIDLHTLDAGRVLSKQLPGSLRGTFGTLNPRVIDSVRRLDSAVITGLQDDVREGVRTAAEEGLRAGQNPRVVAKQIVESVGLSGPQAKAVANFRAELESGDRAALSRVLGRGTIRQPDGTLVTRQAHAGGKGLGKRDMAMLDRVLGEESLSADQVGRMTDAYRKRMLALNAEANARSIALDSNRLAQRLSWEDAAERGVVGRHQLRRTWLAVGGPAGDGRNRPEHLALHGETVGFDSRYSNGELVPGESTINCRCGERITMVPAVRLAA